MHSIAWWPSVIVLAVATVTDLRTRRIPNWLVLPFLVAFLLMQWELLRGREPVPVESGQLDPGAGEARE